ncbi:O-acetylhomoserine aminocarboxypropyltransferase/cysteine synthase family protein [Kiritimatiella glycovorans]|uniref:Methionine gamma-lyase n=1 Tax=Kiritimatiella glycovorans TaxID=1307763 RepID=A0A0G3EFQ4_9BACT|nr:O-acetylhomoserine aminocarboxypropyltransferase/cysteine synthase family protein [Kiritimatiella glycovorans]AKJ64237.1 Methionine gamma-lyase [Kiritimatiella glycovorans]
MDFTHANLETRCLHAGFEADPATGSCAVPVYRTSAYVFRDTRHAADLFALEELGNIYSRLTNPTVDVLERRLAALEGGSAAVALSSGTSAVFYSIINLAQEGDEIVASNRLYGGTYTQFHDILPRFGIKTRFVDPRDPAAFAAAVTPKTRALYTETIGNPGLVASDLPALAEVAHEHGLPLIVDSTFTTPYLLRPLEHGADIVVHSLTKWLGGHGNGIGGVVVDSGRFDWTTGRHPLLSEPDSSYHDVRYATDLGELNPVAYAIRLRLVPLRNLGSCLSPDNAWQFLQGIETLPLRMERHCANADAVARHLETHPKVEWVRYPGLEGDPSHEVAARLLPRGCGGMVVCGLRGGADAGRAFIERLELFKHLANVGDARSLAIHPASTTHSQMTAEEQVEAGIDPGMVRLSVGLEHIDDILADLDRGLEAVE